MNFGFSAKKIGDFTSMIQEQKLRKPMNPASFDFMFERNLNNMSAEYSLNKNCSIKVDNKGYKTKRCEWKQAIGKAKFVGENNIGILQVSFCSLFYSGYNIIAIDEDYQYSAIAGKSLRCLWVLSRNRTITEDIKTRYLGIAEKVGYKISDIQWIRHDKTK